jgi:hypothetical protein
MFFSTTIYYNYFLYFKTMTYILLFVISLKTPQGGMFITKNPVHIEISICCSNLPIFGTLVYRMQYVTASRWKIVYLFL